MVSMRSRGSMPADAKDRACRPLSRGDQKMLLLSNDDVAKVLDMPLCLASLDGVFQEMAQGDSVGMGRIDVYVPSGESTAPYYRWAVMTGGSKKDGYVCARMLSDMVSWPREYGRVRENKWARDPGTFCGLLFLFSARDASPVAMIKDGLLQHFRVGGGAGLGVKYLSRKDSHTVGMSGTGSRLNLRHRRARPSAASTSYRVAPRPTSLFSSTSGWSRECTLPISPQARSSQACLGSSMWPCVQARPLRVWKHFPGRPTISAPGFSAMLPASRKSARSFQGSTFRLISSRCPASSTSSPARNEVERMTIRRP